MYMDGLDSLFKGLVVMLCISAPLSIWKLVDIIIWLVHHVHVSF